MSVSVVEAIRDPLLFQPFLGDDLSTWKNWLTVLRVVYGLPVRQSQAALIRECTGRTLSLMPREGFSQFLCLTGRRSGKSRIA